MSEANNKAYEELEARYRRIALIGEALGILHWDTATMMPDGAAPGRAEQVAGLSLLRHEMLVAPELGDLLEAAAAETLGDWQAANLREMGRARRWATALPADLLEAASKASSASEMCWRQARHENDFEAQRPHLEAVLGLALRPDR